MLDKNIDLYFFSGTGNTFLMTKKIESILKSKDYNIKLFRLERTDPKNINLNHTIGIGVTVAYFSTYPIVWNFFNNMPNTNGTKVFFFDTMGGYSGGLLRPIKSSLEKKGYITLGACEFVMPSNLSSKPMSLNELSDKLKKNQIKAEEFVDKLILGKAKWSSNPILSFLFYTMYKTMNPPAYFRKTAPISVDSSKCIQCGICYKVCPADNIRMYEFPRFEDHCQTCMRCFSYCPVLAIYYKGKNYTPYKAVSLEELLLETTE